MSKRKPSRSPRRDLSARPPDTTAPRAASWARIILLSVAGLVLTLVVVFFLFAPYGMLNALLRTEYFRLDRARESSAPQWKDVAQARDAALAAHPDQAAHFAAAELLRLVIKVERGQITPRQAFEEAKPHAAADPQNSLVRLVQVFLVDRVASPAPNTTQPAAIPVQDRFAAARTIMESPPRVRHATLYNAEFTKAWHQVLHRYVRRPDVALTMAAALPHYEIEEHYAALPLVERQWGDLAAELDRQGLIAEAARCRRWVGRTMLDLIETDPDAGTRLLCTDLLANTLGTNSSAAASLHQLRTDYHAHLKRIPLDLADQSFTQRPALAPAAYNAAFHSLMATMAFALAGLSAAVLLIVVGMLGAGQRLWWRSTLAAPSLKRCSFTARVVVVVLPILLAVLLLVTNLVKYGIYSTSWALVALVMIVVLGALGVIVLAGLNTAADSAGGRARMVLPVILWAAGLFVLALPAPIIARAYRAGDLVLGAPWLVFVLPVAVILAAAILSPARFKTMASSAALAWCLYMAAALVVLPFHRVADGRYQQTVIAGRLDEIGTRLGSDWPARYLSAAQEAVGGEVPLPQSEIR